MVKFPATIRGKILTALAVIAGLLVVRQLYLRWSYESEDRMVEVCLELEQVKRICVQNNYPVTPLLERAKTIGVISLVIQEESFETLKKNARVAHFSNEDAVKYEMLGVLGPGAALQADTLVVGNQKLTNYLKTVLKTKNGSEPVEYKTGGYTVLRLNRYLTDAGWGYLPENIETAQNAGLKVVLKPYKDFWIEENLPPNFSAVILSGMPDSQAIAGIRISGAKIAIIEFSNEEALYRKMFLSVPENVYRMHRIEPEKIRRVQALNNVLGKQSCEAGQPFKTNQFIKRWVRSVTERDCRFLYFDFIEGASLEDNLNYLRDTCAALKKSGFILGVTQKPEPFGAPPAGVSKFLSFLAAIIAPLLSAYYVSTRTSAVKKDLVRSLKLFFVVSCMTLCGALFMSALLSGTAFSVKLVEFGGIRTAMLLTFILAIPLFFKRAEIENFIRLPASSGILLLLAAAAVAGYVMLLRTGNMGEIPASESSFRAMLENLFVVRPRFKEFFLGHPLMLLGIYLNSAPLLLAGIIGQISIMNTFMHAHTPLYVSLLRTIYGMLLGGFIGCLAVSASEYFARKCSKT